MLDCPSTPICPPDRRPAGSAACFCWEVDAGLLGYEQALLLQKRCVAARKAGAIPDLLLFCEHPHVITLGRNGRPENLLAGRHLLRRMGVEFHITDRGGDITYHGPGQIVGYPILDLGAIRRDVRWYACSLEEVMIRAASSFGVSATRIPGKTGVWVASGGRPEKLAAIGVHLSRWVTSHGFAFNVCTDLRYFDLIVPCGVSGCVPASLEKILDRPVAMAEARAALSAAFSGTFSRHMQTVALPDLASALARAEAASAMPLGV